MADPGRSSGVLGRHAELEAIERFLDTVGDGSSVPLLLSGPAGIGKTTLWSAGVGGARRRGFRVVSAQPTEVETGLAFATLGDVLGPFLEDAVVGDMPEPQRDALDGALLRADAPSPPHPLGVSLGALHVLHAAATDAPVLVAIDDVQWVDDASARVLEFVVRRLGGERIGFLLTRRAASPDEPLPRWLATLPPDRLSRPEVGPLSLDQIGALLRRRLQLTLSRPALARIHEISGGTPFYAIELGRAVQLRDASLAPDAPEVPRSLDRLIGARLESLDPAAAEVALFAAALAQPALHVLAATLGDDRTAAGIDGAVAAGVLDVAGGSVRFAHPLLAAAAYGRAAPADRRRVHARLAEIVTESEERARHLARSTVGPDATVARALEDGAAEAARRGAAAVAAELAEEAARLTPAADVDERHRRQSVAAEHWIVAGDLHRADGILATLATGLDDGPLRADVLTRRALLALYLTNLGLAGDLLREAMALTADDPRRRVTIHALLAGIGHLSWTDWRRARLHMWEALRLARETGDRALELQMLGHAATWRFGLGRPWRDLIERADALGVPVDAVPALEHPDLQFARLLSREGDIAHALGRIERLIESARSSRDWTSLPRLLVSLASIEIEGGRWERADGILDEAQAGLLQSGEGAFLRDLTVLRLTLHVHRGEVDAARALAAEVAAQSEGLPQPLYRTAAPLALAMLDMSLGDVAAAHQRLGPVLAEPGLGRLWPVRWESLVALETEALVGLGEVATARRRIDPVTARARRRGPPSALAEAVRARAVALAAGGEAEAALAAAEEAVEIQSGLELPFRAARAWLTLGEIRRRSRQKAAARAAFRQALDGFEALGASIWADRARDELGRVAGRRPAGSALTDTERRVAELAGSGQTNREIADALFMSVHTVEAHLTRIFRALGIQSRTALARADLDTAAASDGAATPRS